MHRPRLSLSKIMVGILSLFLLLVSTASIVLVTQQANAMTSTSSLHGAQHNFFSKAATGTTVSTATDTPSPTPTDTPSPTPTDTPSPTPTDTPSPTPTDTPSPTPTPTDTPSPTPTDTPTPKPTSTPSSSPTPRATGTALPTATASPHATPGATTPAQPTSTVSTGQGGGPVSTPIDTSTVTSTFIANNDNGTPQDAANAASHFMEIVVGILSAGIFLFLLFLGGRQLRKHLLLAQPAKLPPSGALPWSRDRVSSSVFSSWEQVNNYQQVELSHTANAPGQEPVTFINADTNVFARSGYVPAGSDFTPFTGSFQPVANQDYPPATDQFASIPYATGPENAVRFQHSMLLPPMSDINNNSDARPVALPLTNGQPAASVPNQAPDLSDPYLREMLRHYSEKGRDVPVPNDFPWSSNPHE